MILLLFLDKLQKNEGRKTLCKLENKLQETAPPRMGQRI